MPFCYVWLSNRLLISGTSVVTHWSLIVNVKEQTDRQTETQARLKDRRMDIIINRFYIALFSALEQTHCARM